MTKGYSIRLNDIVLTHELIVQLFNGQRWKIRGESAIRFSTLLQDGKNYDVEFSEGKTEKIFEEIKIVFDSNERVIAQRIRIGLPLNTVRVNKVFDLKRKKTRKAALSIYQVTENQMDREYGQKMSNYWYSNKHKGFVKK